MKKQTASNNQFLAGLKKQLPARKFRSLSALYNEKADKEDLVIAEKFINDMIENENEKLRKDIEPEVKQTPRDLSAELEPKAKAEPKTKAKKPGIIAHIIEILKDGELTKDEILISLTAAFPEREPIKMKATINAQVPSRLRKDKNLNVIKTDKGFMIK